MADSDSDADELQENILMDSIGQAKPNKKKTNHKEEKYIYEGEDSIVDLADIKAMSSIGSEYLDVF